MKRRWMGLVGLVIGLLLSGAANVAPALAAETPVVRAVMFWSPTCPHCHDVIENVLPPLKAQYRDQFELLLIELRTSEDRANLRQTAEQYGMTSYGVPFLVIGDRVLMGANQIPAYLPGLIDEHLAGGGLDWPDIPGLDTGIPFELPAEGATAPVITVEQPRAEGHTLAVAIMAAMAAALAYVAANATRLALHRPVIMVPAWVERSTPWLALAGLAVAGYMAYIETQAVEAVCGPVGDCNAVQSSSYAKLFGVLPIGVLGVIGYVAILAAWLWAHRQPERMTALIARRSVLSMAVFGTLFSLYLTYLEPFVIKAVCAWCLTSAVIITLLMLANTAPALDAAHTTHTPDGPPA